MWLESFLMDLARLQKKLNYSFKDESILLMALTHSSWVNEHPHISEHNERLEFLGDAVLELCVSAEIFQRYPGAREGELTRIRSSLVNTEKLVLLAREIQLEKYILLAKGEESQGGRQRAALLADTMEAVIGSIFIDGGFFAVRKVIIESYSQYWPKNTNIDLEKDYKTRLQEEIQKQTKALPKYILEQTHGLEHEKIFDVCVELPNGKKYKASGTSLKRAEQEAAKIALESLL